jgi:adenylate cyclase
MNARLERKLRLLSGIVAAGIIAGVAFSTAMDRSLIVGIAYGLLISLMLGGIELFVMEGPMLVWLSGLSFTTKSDCTERNLRGNYHHPPMVSGG